MARDFHYKMAHMSLAHRRCERLQLCRFWSCTSARNYLNTNASFDGADEAALAPCCLKYLMKQCGDSCLSICAGDSNCMKISRWILVERRGNYRPSSANILYDKCRNARNQLRTFFIGKYRNCTTSDGSASKMCSMNFLACDS